MHSQIKSWHPYVSPFDPCPPLRVKYYVTPPQLYIGFQPYNLPQYTPQQALKCGTLWPEFYSPYYNPYEQGREDEPDA